MPTPDFASTTYTPGNAATLTQAPSRLRPNDGAVLDFLKQLAARRARLQAQRPQTPAPGYAAPSQPMHHVPQQQENKPSYHEMLAQHQVATDPTPASFGEKSMNSHGQFGTYVDPLNVPASLQGQIKGGFYGRMSNWDSSNPQIAGTVSGWGEAPRGGGMVTAPKSSVDDPRMEEEARRMALMNEDEARRQQVARQFPTGAPS